MDDLESDDYDDQFDEAEYHHDDAEYTGEHEPSIP